jgi:hypothetical protein
MLPWKFNSALTLLSTLVYLEHFYLPKTFLCSYLFGYPNRLIPFHSEKARGLKIYVASNNKMYLHLHINSPWFLSHFNQIWTFLTDFNKSLQHQIVQYEFSSYVGTDGMTNRHYKANGCFLQLYANAPNYGYTCLTFRHRASYI